MNILDRRDAIVKGLVGAETRHVRPGAAKAGKRQPLRGVRKKELHRKRVLRSEMVIEVRVKLVFLERRRRGTGVAAVGLRSGNDEISIGQPRVEQRKCRRVNGRNIECRLKRLRGTVIGQPRGRGDEYALGKAVDDGGTVRFARSLVGDKEEGPAFPHRAAQRAAEDAPLQHRPSDAGRFQEGIVGIQSFIAEVFVHAPVQGVRAAFRKQLDVGTASPTEAGVVERGLHYEFLDSFRCRDSN